MKKENIYFVIIILFNLYFINAQTSTDPVSLKEGCYSDKDCDIGQFCEFSPCNSDIGLCRIIPKECDGTKSYICGCDGTIYNNDCERKLNKVSKNYDGNCINEISNVSCDADDFFKGTCDFIGTCITFPGIGSRCAVNFEGYKNYYPCPYGFEFRVNWMFPRKVTCAKDCLLDDNCGSTQYANFRCYLTKYCDPSTTPEECKNEPCRNVTGICLEKKTPCSYYSPICSCDNKTYKNICFLMEDNAVFNYHGECEGGNSISDIVCDSQNPCPQGLQCYKFPNLGLRCALPNPCDYYECPEQKECNLGESFPPQVICSGECLGKECEKVVGFDIETQETVHVSKISKDLAYDVTLKTTSSGFKGTLEVNNIIVPYSERLFVEESKLYMNTSEGKKQINIFPGEIINKYNIDKNLIREIKLIEEKSIPVYSLDSEKKVKFLILIPTKINVEQKINGEDGSIVSAKKPWWSFLSSEVKLQ